MGVISTDMWLLDDHNDPIKICDKMESLFPGVDSADIYHHLMVNGMYQIPLKNGKQLIQHWQRKKVWSYVDKEFTHLKNNWNGPDIPIFIFPSSTNRELKKENNGKSGLAFADKLFLFISDETSRDETKALLIHEYNHVCRLRKYNKKEQDYVLLDSIILEGLAEQAVHEKMGEEHVAKWCKYYPDDMLEKWWKTKLLPNSSIPKSDRRHQNLLYGFRLNPKMLGYSVGYYLVQQYVKENKLNSKDLMSLSSEEIAQLDSGKQLFN
ncbi:DUF2268 domain-containing putative Zn-dependent protease [Virgibacillus kimchii]